MVNIESNVSELKLIIGGAGKMEAVIDNRVLTMSSAKVETESIWDELCDWCTSEAKKAGITENYSNDLLLQVRKYLDESSR